MKMRAMHSTITITPPKTTQHNNNFNNTGSTDVRSHFGSSSSLFSKNCYRADCRFKPLQPLVCQSPHAHAGEGWWYGMPSASFTGEFTTAAATSVFAGSERHCHCGC